MQLRANTLACIAQIILEATPVEQATREAGLHRHTLPKALAKPEVQNYVVALKEWHDRQREFERLAYISEAVDQARELMLSTKSDSVKLRAMEFISKHAPQHSHSVSASPDPAPNAAQSGPQAPGYTYKSPPDTQSGAARDKDQENKGDE